MNLKSLLLSVDKNAVIARMFELHPDELEWEAEHVVYLDNLTRLPAIPSNMRILVKEYQEDPEVKKFMDEKFGPDEDQTPEIHVSGRDGITNRDTCPEYTGMSESWLDSETTYALEFKSADEWLGMEIDQESFTFPPIDIIAHCLVEMTFCGFDDLDKVEKISELQSIMHEYDLGKGSFLTHDEVVKRVKEKFGDGASQDN
jgi:hypothetical protein